MENGCVIIELDFKNTVERLSNINKDIGIAWDNIKELDKHIEEIIETKITDIDKLNKISLQGTNSVLRAMTNVISFYESIKNQVETEIYVEALENFDIEELRKN